MDSLLTVDAVFAGRDLRGEIVQDLQCSPNGSFVSFLRAAPDDANSTVLWLMSTIGGATRALLDTRTLDVTEVNLSDASMKFQQRRHLPASGKLEVT